MERIASTTSKTPEIHRTITGALHRAIFFCDIQQEIRGLRSVQQMAGRGTPKVVKHNDYSNISRRDKDVNSACAAG